MATALRATICLRPGPSPTFTTLPPKVIERDAARSAMGGGLGRTGHGPVWQPPFVQSGRCSHGRVVRGRVISKNPWCSESTWMASQSRTRVRSRGSRGHHGTLESVRRISADDDRRCLGLCAAESVGNLHGVTDRDIPLLVVGRCPEPGIEAGGRDAVCQQGLSRRACAPEVACSPFAVETVDDLLPTLDALRPRRCAACGD